VHFPQAWQTIAVKLSNSVKIAMFRPILWKIGTKNVDDDVWDEK